MEVALDDRRHIPVEFASLALPLTCVSLGLAGETWLPERLPPTPTRNARVPGGEGDVFVIDSLLSRVIYPYAEEDSPYRLVEKRPAVSFGLGIGPSSIRKVKRTLVAITRGRRKKKTSLGTTPQSMD